MANALSLSNEETFAEAVRSLYSKADKSHKQKDTPIKCYS